MNLTGYHHIRFTNNSDYDINVEDFIKSIERNFNIDFRSLPKWKDLICDLYKVSTNCRRKIRDANFRKLLIINKIYLQWCRPSPFTLTDNLVRTSRKWKKLKKYYDKELNISEQPESLFISNIALSRDELNEASEMAHPNTEIVPSEELIIEEKINIDAKTNVPMSESLQQTFLPISVRTNLHKYVSPLDSKDTSLSDVTVISYSNKVQMEIKEQELPKQALAVKCFPDELIIEDTSLDEQCIKFSLINCIFKQLHVRFKCVADKSPFKKIKVFPATTIRLYPGVTRNFKLLFKLFQNTENFVSSIYFKVGHIYYNVLAETSAETLYIPIVSKFNVSRLVSVSELVSIPPVYTWQIKCGYPKTAVTVVIGDKNKYDVHITKRIVDYTKDHGEIQLSMEGIAPYTESIEDRMVDSELNNESKMFTSLNDELSTEVEKFNSLDITSSILEEILERSLDTFLFDKTYLHMKPNTKRKVYVMFSKAERIGKHQCYYDFEFYEPETEKFILKRTAKIFAEVLPHPVQIHPIMLDMTHSPITHGYCKDVFTITNTHKLYPAMIKIKLTSKMHRMFSISPMEVVIPTTSSVRFEVMFCSTNFLSEKRSDDLVHFTLKILVYGQKSLYDCVPPFFYEIIAPCALEFKNIYNQKYYTDVSEKCLTSL